jgi:hypothetical protein
VKKYIESLRSDNPKLTANRDDVENGERFFQEISGFMEFVLEHSDRSEGFLEQRGIQGSLQNLINAPILQIQEEEAIDGGQLLESIDHHRDDTNKMVAHPLSPVIENR